MDKVKSAVSTTSADDHEARNARHVLRAESDSVEKMSLPGLSGGIVLSFIITRTVEKSVESLVTHNMDVKPEQLPECCTVDSQS